MPINFRQLLAEASRFTRPPVSADQSSKLGLSPQDLLARMQPIISKLLGSRTIEVTNPPPLAKLNQFKATYYDPWDPKQTKPKPDGIGAFNKPVVFGDVAIPRDSKLPQGSKVFVQELSDVKTPWGMGTFRVNDKLGEGSDKQSTLDIALPYSAIKNEFKELRKRIGNNQFNYSLVDK